MRAVALPPVAQELTAKLPAPRCAPKPAEAYPPDVIGDQIRCLESHESLARTRHASLASAVRVREAKAAELAGARDR